MADCKCCGGFMGTKLPLAIQGVACASCIYEVNHAMLERKGKVADGFKRHEERLAERLEEMPKLGAWESIKIAKELDKPMRSIASYKLRKRRQEQKRKRLEIRTS